ncbi:MAG: S26 family signal peptidase [Thermoplasmatales archaeon]
MTFKYRSEVISAVVILAVIAIIFSSLYFYTGNWPSAVIVESSSMQHGNNFVFGVINTGDIVGVKKIDSFTNVQTYLVARERGNPTTYGEYGNVIVYKNYLLRELVIHRAIFYVEGWNGTTPILYGNTHPSWLSIQGPDVYIYDVGYSHKNLLVQLQNYIGQEGFITMGDHNFADSAIDSGNYTIAADQNVGIDNSLVSMNQVVGVAVGYLPIIGVLKLWVTGQTTFIPEDSNAAMIIIIILVIALAVAPLPSVKFRRKGKHS